MHLQIIEAGGRFAWRYVANGSHCGAKCGSGLTASAWRAELTKRQDVKPPGIRGRGEYMGVALAAAKAPERKSVPERPHHDHWPTPHLPPGSVHLRTAAYVIREGHLSKESGRRQTARGASNGTVCEERIRKGGGALEVTRPTRLSRPRRNNNEAAYQARTVTV